MRGQREAIIHSLRVEDGQFSFGTGLREEENEGAPTLGGSTTVDGLVWMTHS